MIDLGTGNNNKINWPMQDKQEFIDIVEVVYRGARKGRGLVVSPKDYSTKYKYALLQMRCVPTDCNSLLSTFYENCSLNMMFATGIDCETWQFLD